MTFIWPYMLFSLLFVPLIILWQRQMGRRRERDAARLGALGIVNAGGGSKPSRWRRILPFALFLVGISVLLFSTARPQVEMPVPQIEGVVMLVMDVSASMAAEDMQPTRMEAAKAAAQAFVERQPPNIKVGVVAFSDGGLVVQPPTNDRGATAATIDRLVPQSGTSIGQGILVALNAAAAPDASGSESASANPVDSQPVPAPSSPFAPTIIVLLTDGENTEQPDPLEAAQVAVEQGVRIYPIGVGSTAGTVLEIDGFNVFTSLNEDILKEIASLSEGEYYRAENEEELKAIYENIKPEFVIRSEKIEITALLAGVSALFLLVGGFLSLLWFGRAP